MSSFPLSSVAEVNNCTFVIGLSKLMVNSAVPTIFARSPVPGRGSAHCIVVDQKSDPTACLKDTPEFATMV